MLDAIRLMARYHVHANAEMNKVLATLTREEWEAPRGGYFPSFRALTSHLYVADITWLVRFSGLRPFAALKGAPFDFPPSFSELAFGDFAEYQTLRTALDAAMTAFVAELTEADVVKTLSYRNIRGEEFAKQTGGLLLHVFNHATHHRGHISMLLDQMGKANDYSSVVPLVGE